MDTTKNDIFLNEQYLQWFGSKIMAKDFVTAKYFNRRAITQGTVETISREEGTDGKILDAITKKARPIAEGADLTKIRGTVNAGKAMNLNLYGYEYTFTDVLRDNPSFDLEKEVMDMSYSLSKIVEKANIEKMISVANSPEPDSINGNWADAETDANMIQADIIDFQSAYDSTDYSDELNCLFYNKKQYNAIRKNLNYTASQFEIPEQGYISGSRNPIEYVESANQKSKFMPDGTCLGFDMTNPPGTLFYAVQPGNFSPQTYEGLADYAPFIRSFIKRDEGVNASTTIQMAVSFGLQIDRPGALFKTTGL